MPIIAGLDKFTNILTDWSQYISPALSGLNPLESGTFMIIVGIIEIAAGILVFLKPKIGALVAKAWLIAISLTLIYYYELFNNHL